MKLSKIFAVVFITALPIYAEVSVFDAGNLDSSDPYGLTKDEKILLHNKKKVEILNQNYSSVDAKLNSIMQSIEGIKSIIESNSNRINKIERRLSILETKMSIGLDTNNTSDIFNFDDLRKYSIETRNIESQNYKKITYAIKGLSSLIESINSKPTEKLDFKGKKSSVILSEADKFFKNKKYDKAQSMYRHLVDIRYKPAYCNYMLGEISYIDKSYKDAIKYYKASITLYDKGDYTSRLLYHTAVSFDKIGDSKSANKFYKALKIKYPKSKEAKISPNRK